MVRAGKLKSGAAKKVNRWQSSSTANARTHRHRRQAMAKKGLIKDYEEHDPKGLSKDKLRLLDKMTGSEIRDEEDIPIEEVDLTSEASAATFKTFVSGVSDCTNMTFNRVRRHWEQNAEKHKETVAVLAAITEVIREKKFEDENETAYFAVLSTTLSQVTSEESLAAVAYLFSLNLRQVAPGVIHKNFGELICTILTLLAKNFTSTALLKALVSCLGTVLRRGTNVETWETQDAKTALSVLTAFVLHAKPKVRKAGQKAVAILLNTTGISQIAVEEVARFCSTELQKSTNDSQTLHLMAFIRSVISVFSLSSQKDICQICLRLQTLSSRMVRIHALKTLNDFLRGIVRTAQKIAVEKIKESATDDIDLDELRDRVAEYRLANLPVELISKLIIALRDVRPSAGDKQVCLAWLEVMHSCCFTLSASDQPRTILDFLPQVIESVLVLMEEFDLAPDGSSTLQKCFIVALRHIDSSDLEENKIGHVIVKEILNGISYKYSAVIDSTMNVLASFYNSLPEGLQLNEKTLHFLLTPLDGLKQLRQNPLFDHKISLDATVGSILALVGPRFFLQKLPLDITGDPAHDGDIPARCGWILPILEEKLEHRVELNIFFTVFAQLADRLIKAAGDLDKYQAPIYQTLYREIWALFPKFCQNPIDQPETLLKPGSAKGLNSILESESDNHKEVKTFVLSGLRKLAIFALKDGNEKQRAVLEKYSKNYLKTMLNLYRSKDFSATALSTAKEFVKIADTSKITEFYQVAEEKAKNDPDETSRPLYWDIVVLLAPYLSETNIRRIFTESLEMTKSDNATIQKKAWRLMEQIASSKTEVCSKIIDDNIKTIIEQMMITLSTCAASARKPRLQLLGIILDKIEDVNFLRQIIPELVICTKDNNTMSRSLAFRILSAICQKFVSTGDEMGDEPVLAFIQILLQGLTGNPLGVACTLNVLTVIMYEFKDQIPAEVYSMILENVLLLMSSAAREILKATVSFLITLTKTLPTDDLAPHVERILTAVVNWKPETRNPFRLKVRRLLERLVKKFGFDIIQKFVPEKSPIAKMLANAKKIQKRTEKRRAENKGNEPDSDEDEDVHGAPETLDDLIRETDSEAEEDEELKNKKKIKGKKGQYKTRIHEDGDDFVDFLSTTAAQSLTVKKDQKVRKEKKANDDDEIGTASDGRIIVREKKKMDVDMLSSDEEEGLPENIRMSDQKAAVAAAANEEYGRSKKGNKTELVDRASNYRSKKAGGDVKKSGQHDPYSYLPLRKDMLNKRKKRQGGSVPGLKNIVKGAKKGVQRGKARNKKGGIKSKQFK